LVLMLLTALPFVFLLLQNSPSDAIEAPDPLISYVEIPVKADTVYITLPADTLIKERLVYRKVYLPADTVYKIAEIKDAKPKDTFIASEISTTIADNKALADLVISID
ncbi:MAG: hypothetical protein WBA74_04785, partial [Cyclobacteriaceae bacterium]